MKLIFKLIYTILEVFVLNIESAFLSTLIVKSAFLSALTSVDVSHTPHLHNTNFRKIYGKQFKCFTNYKQKILA